jgi:VCBS repeat-containing protein
VRFNANGVLSNPGTATVDSTGGGTDTEAVAFTEPPVANADAYAVNEGATLNVAAAGVLANDLKGGWVNANHALKAVAGTLPGNGTLTLNDDGSFSYDHDGSETLFDTFTYQAQAFKTSNSNNLGTPSTEAVVTITINPVNDPPVAIDDAATTDDDTAVVIDVLANDTDADGDVLSVNLFTQGANGTVICDTAPTLGGTCTYTPTGTGEYVDTFTYDATDGTDVSNTATVTVTVTSAANQPPVAVNDFATFTLGGPATIDIDVAANDTDPDGTVDPTTVCIRLGSFPSNCANANPKPTKKGGTVTNNYDGTVTYQPAPGFLGTDNFNYRVQDNNEAWSKKAKVRVNVVQ